VEEWKIDADTEKNPWKILGETSIASARSNVVATKQDLQQLDSRDHDVGITLLHLHHAVFAIRNRQGIFLFWQIIWPNSLLGGIIEYHESTHTPQNRSS